jgi:hypothetical protein
MKLIMIQGDVFARYINGQQHEVVRVDWEQIEDPKDMIEDIRVHGIT